MYHFWERAASVRPNVLADSAGSHPKDEDPPRAPGYSAYPVREDEPAPGGLIEARAQSRVARHLQQPGREPKNGDECETDKGGG